MSKIKIMISSTVEDLLNEREAISEIFQGNPFFELVGAKPFLDSSSAKSSFLQTTKLAKECDLYILILGKRFGWELDNGRSATEIEFDTAIKQDPTKILVFLKKESDIEEKQKKFINKVSEYYSGYWRVEFEKTDQLKEYVKESVLSWLKDRASFNDKVTYCEHFVREAIQLKPTNDTNVYYSVREDYVEIEYHAMKQTHTIQCEKTKIFSDFWKSLYIIQEDITRWSNTWND